MTKEEFVDWKSDSRTKTFFNKIIERVDDLKEALSYSAGSDSATDLKTVGYLQGLRDVLSVTYEDISEGE